MRERRERPVAVGILAGSLAFRLFAVGYMAFTLAVSLYFAPRAARASTVTGRSGSPWSCWCRCSCSTA